jgi:hypothetical protein
VDVEKVPEDPLGATDKRPRITATAITQNRKLTRKVVAKTGGTLPLPYIPKIMNDAKQPQADGDRGQWLGYRKNKTAGAGVGDTPRLSEDPYRKTTG